MPSDAPDAALYRRCRMVRPDLQCITKKMKGGDTLPLEIVLKLYASIFMGIYYGRTLSYWQKANEEMCETDGEWPRLRWLLASLAYPVIIAGIFFLFLVPIQCPR